MLRSVFTVLAILGLVSRTYATTLDVDFSRYASSGSKNVETWLNQEGLTVADWSVDESPHTVQYSKSNVDILDGNLRLKVSGNNDGNEVTAGQVATTDESILYGTFTTVAKLTTVPGVCQGLFTYFDDNHEVDIELLSSYYTQGYGDSVQPGIQLTNQPLSSSVSSTSKVTAFPEDPTAGFHEYTLEWTKSYTRFYFDGELLATLKANVPKKASVFVWNNWSSGDPNWSAGPPTEDAYFLIKSISLDYTTV